MRSKEVDEALTLIELQRNGALIGGDKIPSRYKPLVTSVITIDILLNYIMKLETKSNKCDYFEKENKFLRDENNIYINETVSKQVIREKIKELELEEDRIYKLDYELEREKAIDVVISKRVLLESLLGE